MTKSQTGDNNQIPVNEIVNARRGVHTINAGLTRNANGEMDGK